MTSLLLLTIASTGHAADLLRYRFETGDWLTYDRRVTAVHDAERTAGRATPAAPTERIDLWCLDSRFGEFQILLSHTTEDAGGAVSRGVLLRVDARGLPTGANEMARSAADLDFLFDVLPILQSPLDDRSAWRTTAVPGRLALDCRIAERTDAPGGGGATSDRIRIEFQSANSGPAAPGRSARRGVFEFDAARGQIERAAGTFTSADGATGETQVTLRRRMRHDAGWCALRIEEAESFLRATRRQEALLDEIVGGTLRVEDAVAENSRLWAALRRDLAARGQSPFDAIAATRARRMRDAAGTLQRLRGYADAQRGRPASGWSLQDAEGRTHDSATARRGWTLECFWSMHQPVSAQMPEALIRTRAELVAAAAATPGQRPPAITLIGLNIDPELEPAARAMRAAPSGMLHVHADSLAALAPPPELPCTRLIDPDGVVRGMYFGWRPSLAEPLGSIIGGRK
ncbi:MAG: hypothetical protein HRU75_02290 [Planctomycetia bacterium]|nr:MAG: hypothetical protein HRU75_02290 [Planctomycetia bacterium]